MSHENAMSAYVLFEWKDAAIDLNSKWTYSLNVKYLNFHHRLREDFVQMMKTIQSNPKFQRLTLDSYIMLPMQRITRFPLLMTAIIKKVAFEDEKNRCVQALENLTQVKCILL